MKNNPLFWLFIAFPAFIPPSVSAEPKEIIRYTDDEGNAVFTDQPPAGVDEIETIIVDPAQSFILPSPTYNADAFVTPKKRKQKGTTYTKFEFTAPIHEATIRDNEGIVSYNIAIEPGLRPTDKVKVTLDGKEVSAATNGQLTNVFRGSHVLQAEIISKSTGKTVQSSSPVTIYVHRQIIRQNRPPAAQ